MDVLENFIIEDIHEHVDADGYFLDTKLDIVAIKLQTIGNIKNHSY